MADSPIPTIDVLPPLTGKARDILYGVLAWVAGVLGIITAIYGINPDAGIPHWLVVTNAVVVGLWSLGGFKAKANVTRGAHRG